MEPISDKDAKTLERAAMKALRKNRKVLFTIHGVEFLAVPDVVMLETFANHGFAPATQVAVTRHDGRTVYFFYP